MSVSSRGTSRYRFGLLILTSVACIQLLIEQRNYSHLPTYVFKAEAALDAATANLSNNNNAPSGASSAPVPMVTTGSKKKSAERENVQSKLDLATALSHLGQANYEKAAFHLLRIGPAKELGDWVGKASDPKVLGYSFLIGPLDHRPWRPCCLWNTLRTIKSPPVLTESSVAGKLDIWRLY